jgi:AGCS family alanine or glycine:cation symporter
MYRMIVLCFLALGSYLQVNLVWELADLFNGLMVLPNLVALVALAKVVDKALANFDAGLPPEELHASVPKKYSLD